MQTNARVPNRDGHPSDFFSLPDTQLWTSLADLRLNIAQTATLCGISVRQLGYWTKQGYVTAEGLGERRIYGLEALRRILSIRRLMSEGASLRQALRALPEPGALPAPRPETEPDFPALSYNPEPAEADALTPEDASALSRQVVRLFDGNRRLRDSAEGLAVKLGRSAAPVRHVAEALCAQGVLIKTLVQNEAIFQRLEGATR